MAATGDRDGNRGGWVKVNDCLEWIGECVLSIRVKREVPLEDVAESPGEQEVHRDADGGVNGESRLFSPRPEQIRSWASAFVARLKKRQREALWYVDCEGLRLEEAAARMGLKTPSGVSPHKEAVRHALRGYIMELEGGFGVTFDEDALHAFRDALRDLLEDDPERRSEVTGRDDLKKNASGS